MYYNNSYPIVIFGPTASGKSSLGIQLAQLNKGTIINADSRQIYRNMPIISAMPTAEERKKAPHLGFEFKNPDEKYTAKQYIEDAHAHLSACKESAHSPILVGGTGLYINCLLEGIQNSKDVPSTPFQPYGFPYPTFKIALLPAREQLYKNIHNRYEKMLHIGLEDELYLLFQNYPQHVDNPINGLSGIGIKFFFDYFSGKLSFDDASSLTLQAMRNYAKRQITWLRHNYPYHVLVENNSAESIKRIMQAHEAFLASLQA